MATLEQQLADAIAAQNALTQAVATYKQQLDQSVAAQKAAYDAWKGGLTPGSINAEPRYQFDIKIMGSPDYLYPVWWIFPGNDFPGGKITISRHYSWDGGSGTADARLRQTSQVHIAALNLVMEGNACLWDGDANYMKVLFISERYNNLASHASAGIPCLTKAIDPTKPLDYSTSNSMICSGVYLRGGGLTYRITSNFTNAVGFIDGTKGPDEQRYLYSSGNGQVYVQPKPFAQLVTPVVG